MLHSAANTPHIKRRSWTPPLPPPSCVQRFFLSHSKNDVLAGHFSTHSSIFYVFTLGTQSQWPNFYLRVQLHALRAGMCAVVKVQKRKKKYSEEIHVDSDNMVPPAVGLCLAFVLIPSHRWVQARGPPTSSCQRRLRQRHSNMAVCLNYYSTLENTQQQARS